MTPHAALDGVQRRLRTFFAPRPPGPSVLQTFKHLKSLSSSPLEFMRDGHDTWGDTVFHRIGHVPVFFFFHPDQIEEVLLKKNDSFIKDSLTRDLHHLLGDGLLTAEGKHWKKQRKLIAPPLKRKQIAHYADTMVEESLHAVERLRPGRTADIGAQVTALTLEIAGRTFFDSDVAGDVSKISDAMEVAMDHFALNAQTWRQLIPQWMPQPGQKEYQRAVADVDDVLYRIIRERRASGAYGDDLLSVLLQARDEDGSGMDDQQLRDEAVTIFLAGHETTALALTWAIYLYTRVPEAAARLRDEITEVLGDEVANVSHVKALPYAEAFIKETLRLYSPAWIIGREAKEVVEIGGWTIPRGAQVLMPQFEVHRDPRWYKQPETFRPERWLGTEDTPAETANLPRYAFFPFGGGARICIGNHFAMMEAVLCLVTLLQHRDFALVSPAAEGGPGDAPVAPSVTLRPGVTIEVVVSEI